MAPAGVRTTTQEALDHHRELATAEPRTLPGSLAQSETLLDGLREIWPLLVVVGVLLVVVVGLLVAQWTDPDRKRGTADRRARIDGIAAADAAPAAADEPDTAPGPSLPPGENRSYGAVG